MWTAQGTHCQHDGEREYKAEQDGRGRPLVKEFSGVAAGDAATIAIDLIACGDQPASDTPPILCGIEIAAD